MPNKRYVQMTSNKTYLNFFFDCAICLKSNLSEATEKIKKICLYKKSDNSTGAIFREFPRFLTLQRQRSRSNNLRKKFNLNLCDVHFLS